MILDTNQAACYWATVFADDHTVESPAKQACSRARSDGNPYCGRTCRKQGGIRYVRRSIGGGSGERGRARVFWPAKWTKRSQERPTNAVRRLGNHPAGRLALFGAQKELAAGWPGNQLRGFSRTELVAVTASPHRQRLALAYSGLARRGTLVMARPSTVQSFALTSNLVTSGCASTRAGRCATGARVSAT